MNSTDQASHLDGFKTPTGAAGGECSTGGNPVQPAAADACLHARLTLMMATRNRLQAELEEHRARAAMYRAFPHGACESQTLALMAEEEGDRVRDVIARVTGRIDAFMQQHPQLVGQSQALRLTIHRTDCRHAFLAAAQQVIRAMSKHSPVGAADMVAVLCHRETTPRGVRRLCGDVQAEVRAAHASVLADEAPHARVTIDISHNTIVASAALSMGGSYSASRTWCRDGAGCWRSNERDFAQRNTHLGTELAEFLDGLDLPERVADMLPVRRHGTDTAELAAAAKAFLAQG